MKEQVSTSTTPPLGRELRLIYMSRILTTIRNLLCPWPPPDRWITPFPNIPVALSRPPLLHYHPTYDLSSSPLPPPAATIHSYTLEFTLSFPLFALGWNLGIIVDLLRVFACSLSFEPSSCCRIHCFYNLTAPCFSGHQSSLTSLPRPSLCSICFTCTSSCCCLRLYFFIILFFFSYWILH